MKKLTVRKTTYGVSNTPVIKLDFNDGGSIPVYEASKGVVSTTLLDQIVNAYHNGFTLDFQGFSSEGDDSNG